MFGGSSPLIRTLRGDVNMNYCCLYCIGDCRNVLFGTSNNDMGTSEGSSDGIFICENCEKMNKGKSHPLKHFAKTEKEIINNNCDIYHNWRKDII